VFDGRFNQELFEEYKKWLPFITLIFLPLIDSENGDFRHFPFEGSLMDQPYITMEILRLIQLNYRIQLHKKIKR
jgi:hypothetical protein